MKSNGPFGSARHIMSTTT